MLAQKLQETVDLGGVQILLQGGLNPELPLAYYEDLFRWMKANFPLAIHGLSPEEIRYIAEIESAAHAHGASSGWWRPGWTPSRAAAPRSWTTTSAATSRRSSARPRPGWRSCARGTPWVCAPPPPWCSASARAPEQLFGHLEHLRALQDETAGFTAFICWPFQAEGTRLKLRDDTTAMRYLRVFAASRLYLDNFPSLQVSWPTMGPEVGQVALRFGGNDFGSAMIEENVVSQAGAVFKLSRRGHRALRPRRRLHAPPAQHALRAARRGRGRCAPPPPSPLPEGGKEAATCK